MAHFHYLRTLREHLGYSQADLARKSDVAQNTISKLETNPESNPSFLTVKRLADVLKVHPSSLRFGPDPAQKSFARRKARMLVS